MMRLNVAPAIVANLDDRGQVVHSVFIGRVYKEVVVIERAVTDLVFPVDHA